MRALVVRQPWASLIEQGTKTIELRSWSTNYRGSVLICAGAALWTDAKHSWPINGPRGVTLCIVDLVECRVATSQDAIASGVAGLDFSMENLYAWELKNPRSVKRLSNKGQLGLYVVDSNLLARVEA